MRPASLSVSDDYDLAKELGLMPLYDTYPDVAVIGAGPAGATAATLLARAGRRVVVFEKKHLGRDKICGGCLSGLAVEQVREVLGEDAESIGYRSTRITFVVGRYRIPCRTTGQTRVVDRAELDAELANAAGQAGADMHFETAAALERDASAWAVRINDAICHPRWILLATGLARLPRELGNTTPIERPLVGQQWLQQDEPGMPEPGEIEMHWLRRGYVGLATLATGRTIVALAAETAALSGSTPLVCLQRLNPDAEVFERLATNASQRSLTRGAAGFPWRPRCVGVDNLLLVGDAAGFEEPFSGEGIGQAMRSGRLAAEAIVREESTVERYTESMWAHARTMRRTRLVGELLRTELIHRLASHRPVVPRMVLATIIRRMHIKGAR